MKLRNGKITLNEINEMYLRNSKSKETKPYFIKKKYNILNMKQLQLYRNKPDFSFIESLFEQNTIKITYNIITKLKLWHWLSVENPPINQGYLFWRHLNLKKIENNTANIGHSGASFACTMRIMQYISKNGLEKYKQKFSKIQYK